MAMGGSSLIQRGHDGKGLALVVRLPCVKSPQYRDQDSSGMKVLLVDDHEIVRSGLRNLLTSAVDVQISEAANGRDALLRQREDRPGLVLLDLNLPGIGGLELLRWMLLADASARFWCPACMRSRCMPRARWNSARAAISARTHRPRNC